MAINVKVNIDWNKVKESLIMEIDERVMYAFENASMEAVTWAKQQKGYTTQSGSLSSSTGFQMYRDGLLMKSYFEASQDGSDIDGAKAKGIAQGQKVAERRASELGAHICAVIVSGMPYAIHVESKGYDVLTGAEKQFPSILEKWMQKAFAKSNIPYSIT
jgi:hypothetical protein